MLEFVATMPSSPFGAGVLVTLDIVSRLIRLVTVAGAARAGPRGMQPTFIRQNTLAFQIAGSLVVPQFQTEALPGRSLAQRIAGSLEQAPGRGRSFATIFSSGV